MIQKHGVIGAAADARFDEGFVNGRVLAFESRIVVGAPGFVERFSGRRANVFGASTSIGARDATADGEKLMPSGPAVVAAPATDSSTLR